MKYVQLVRRKMKGRERFFVQLVCEGVPYRKPRHRLGQGAVGLDLGPSAAAMVGEEAAFLELFCEEVVRKHRTIRRLQRKLERQRRANNPDHSFPDGRLSSRSFAARLKAPAAR